MRGDIARQLRTQARSSARRKPTENEKLLGMICANLNRRLTATEKRLAKLEGIFLRLGVAIEEGVG